MKRPFLERLFIVLWCLWGLMLFGLLIGYLVENSTNKDPLLRVLLVGSGIAGFCATPIILLQYLVLGFFNPLKPFEPKA